MKWAFLFKKKQKQKPYFSWPVMLPYCLNAGKLPSENAEYYRVPYNCYLGFFYSMHKTYLDSCIFCQSNPACAHEGGFLQRFF